MNDKALKYWATMFMREGRDGWMIATAVTDGERSEHTEETVRKITDVRFGPLGVFAASGPFETGAEADAEARRIQSDDEAFIALGMRALRRSEY